MTTIDRRIIWIAIAVVAALLVWLALDHVLFPALPVPAGAPPITH